MPLPHPPPPSGTLAAPPRSCPDPSVLAGLWSLGLVAPETVAPRAPQACRARVDPVAALSSTDTGA